jgi:aldose 1-epimerase
VQPPSGTQYELQRGGQRLVAVEVGAGLREYAVDGEPILDGFGIDAMADGGRGQPLLPWPNRLADGKYEFNGRQLQMPIDEVARNNASHGLTRWLNWSLVEQTDDRVCLEHVIHPRPGYPFTLALQVEYAVASLGFSVTIRAHNLGQSSLPFGAGQHPYFTVGTPLVDEATLYIPSHTRLMMDAERRLPTGEKASTDRTELHFAEPRAIGTTQLDECYCDLQRDADGYVRATLSGPGRILTVWADEHFHYLQVFSGDTLASDRRRRGLAIEPMTCPPNAFRSKQDLIVLAPDERIELRWGADLTHP